MLKIVNIDEIELYYNLLKKDYPDEINNKTCSEIAELVQSNFNVVCTEQDIFLLHEPEILFNEPTIYDDEDDLEYYYRNVLGIH